MGTDKGNDQVDKVALQLKEREQANLLGLSLGDRTLTDKGLMDIGRAVLVKDKRINNQKKKDEKERNEVLKRAQEALEHQLEEFERLLKEIREEIRRLQEENIQLQKDIDKNNKKIDALREENERIQNLIGRLDNGESEDVIKKDKEYKKAAEEYRRVTGLDPDQIGARGVLMWMKQRNDADLKRLNDLNEEMDREVKNNAARIKELEKRADEYQEQIDEIKVEQKRRNPEWKADSLREKEEKLAETEQQIRKLKESGQDTNIVQEFNQRSHPGIEDRRISKEFTIKSQTLHSTESEIESFMKNLAKAQKIENGADRMAEERKLVSSLSSEAADQLSMSRHTEYLFDENYFKPLGAESTGVSKAAPNLSTNMLLG